MSAAPDWGDAWPRLAKGIRVGGKQAGTQEATQPGRNGNVVGRRGGAVDRANGIPLIAATCPRVFAASPTFPQVPHTHGPQTAPCLALPLPVPCLTPRLPASRRTAHRFPTPVARRPSELLAHLPTSPAGVHALRIFRPLHAPRPVIPQVPATVVQGQQPTSVAGLGAQTMIVTPLPIGDRIPALAPPSTGTGICSPSPSPVSGSANHAIRR
jgi:hypothetical protein